MLERNQGPSDIPMLPGNNGHMVDVGSAMQLDPGGDVTPTDDGGAIIDFTGGKPDSTSMEFTANLAEVLDDGQLGSIATDLVDKFEEDERSRAQWRDTLVKGMDLLGFSIEERTQPWAGACGVFHPILSESVVRFQSEAIMALFPAAGPVLTKIVGRETPEVFQQAKRVQEDMNYQLTERMVEYRDETEVLLFNLPISGSAFRKVYHDSILKRPRALYVPAEDVVVNYGASSIRTAERCTHIMRKTPIEVKKLQASGFWSDIDLPNPPYEYRKVEQKKDKMEGVQNFGVNDHRYFILEMSVDLDIEGIDQDKKPPGVTLPYIVTLDKDSQKVLSIRRNWYEDDPTQTKRQHIVHYKYLPGLGFYGLGLVHLIGGIAKSATSITRQLVDAGTLANLPAGFKTRGLRIKGDSTPLAPGEFRDVDITSGQLKDNIHPLPIKEPSSVLLNLLNGLVDEGRRFASLSDLDVGDISQNMPVGTTLALLERSLKVMSAVQARLHASMKEEFGLIVDIVKDNWEEQTYRFDTGEEAQIKKEDYDDRIDIIPVSDPNASTLAQRMIQGQLVMEMAKTTPGVFDMPELYRNILNLTGMQGVDQIIPGGEAQKPKDPVAENMALLTMKPVKAFIWQDHDAHIQTHMAAAQDPLLQQLVGQSPQAAQIQGALAAHVQEHLAFKYRREIEKEMGVPLPSPDQQLPPDVEGDYSKMVAEAADRVLQRDKQEAARRKAAEQAQDPVVQMQMMELEIKRGELERKKEADAMNHQIKMAELKAKLAQTQAGNMSREKIAGLQAGVQGGGKLLDMQNNAKNRRAEMSRELVRAGTNLAATKMQTDAQKERPRGGQG